MNEIVLNLHMHTRYSDGSGSHLDIARAALRCGLDAVVVTDHNIRIGGMERYYQEGGRSVLVLVGEEIHDRGILPQKNHLLVLGVDGELAALGGDLHALLAAVEQAGGLCFLAHPVDPAAPAFHEPDISWEAWSEHAFTGLELWNGFSELKAHIPTRLHGVFYAFFPAFLARGPLPAAVDQWDRLLRRRPTVAVGGSDAHALDRRLGVLRRTVFPYDHHFRAVNTHVLLDAPLSGVASEDAAAIYAALKLGRCFIGYDLPRSTRGFRFSSRGPDSEAAMGGRLELKGGGAMQAWAPYDCELRLLRDGLPIKTLLRSRALTHRILEPGVYRVEAYRRYLGRRRTWIVSNPIYVR